MQQHQRWERETQAIRVPGMMALAFMLALVGVATAVVAWAMDGAHNGRIAGNEAMAVAGLWGLSGLLMAAAERRFPVAPLRHGARGLLAAGLMYLVMGALLGNARWAVPAARLFGYLGALGSTWAAEALLVRREPGSDVHGLLSLTAAGVGYFACAFEVVRWLGPVFTLPMGEPLTPALQAWQESTRVFVTATVWAVYSLGLMEAGRRLRSPQARLLSAVMLGVAIGYAGAAGLSNLAADLRLQVVSVLVVTGAALAAARLAQRSAGERHPWERLAAFSLTFTGAAFLAAWGVMEIL